MPASQYQLEIRRAGEEDAATIAAVLYESFLEFRALYTAGGFSATTPDAERVLARMSEGPVWVALSQDMMVGTVAAVVKDDSLYMRGMAVVPSGRGSGAGARLLEEVERYASGAGSRRVFLSTTPFLHAAIRLYSRSGFRRSDEGPHDLDGTPLFTMEKVLRNEPPGGRGRPPLHGLRQFI